MSDRFLLKVTGQPVPGVCPDPWAEALEQRFELLGGTAAGTRLSSDEAQDLIAQICDALESGRLRVAAPAGSGWQLRPWLKTALVALAHAGPVAPQPGPLPGTELAALGWIEERTAERRVPAGSFLRRGCFLSPGVVVMPPSTIQAGAWLGPGVRVDSHVLVGSCAQVGEGVVLGSGSTLAGHLIPADTLPVVLERGVVLAGACGVYGSVLIGEGSMLHPGTIVQASLGLYDSAERRWICADASGTLIVPPHVEIGMGLAPAPEGATDIQRLTAIILKRDSGSGEVRSDMIQSS